MTKNEVFCPDKLVLYVSMTTKVRHLSIGFQGILESAAASISHKKHLYYFIEKQTTLVQALNGTLRAHLHLSLLYLVQQTTLVQALNGTLRAHLHLSLLYLVQQTTLVQALNGTLRAHLHLSLLYLVHQNFALQTINQRKYLVLAHTSTNFFSSSTAIKPFWL